MKVIQSSHFFKLVKRLHKNQKTDLDQAVRTIMKDPSIGQEKKGDLAGVYVYKFRMAGQLTLIAYQVDIEQMILQLLVFGPHENFYRDIKRQS